AAARAARAHGRRALLGRGARGREAAHLAAREALPRRLHPQAEDAAAARDRAGVGRALLQRYLRSRPRLAARPAFSLPLTAGAAPAMLALRPRSAAWPKPVEARPR